jgi:hypothetical protein
MGYKIEVRPEDSVIIETWDAAYDPKTDAPQAAKEIIQLMEAARRPTTVIVDMRAKALTFDDILLMAKSASSKDAPSHHPMQRRRIIVTTSDIISMAAEGLDNAVFGHIVVDIAGSVEEALEMARK